MTNKTETTENHNTLHIPSREEFHQNFGGTVYESDFNTEYNYSSSTGSKYADTGSKYADTGSKYAARIMSDFRRENKLYRECLYMKGEMNHEALA